MTPKRHAAFAYVPAPEGWTDEEYHREAEVVTLGSLIVITYHAHEPCYLGDDGKWRKIEFA